MAFLAGRVRRAQREKLLPPRRRRSSTRRAAWWLTAYVPAAIVLGTLRRPWGVPLPVTLPVLSAAPLAVAGAIPPSKLRYAAVGMTYMWMFKVAHESPYDQPERLRERLRVRYPIRFDSLIGGGLPPTQRLQRSLRDPPRVTVLDKLMTVAYASWVTPHLALGWVLLRHPRHLPRYAGRLAAAYHLTTLGYWVVPTAPPWWASEEQGEMNGEVERVVRHVTRALRRKPRQEHDQGGGNPWASMPSDHVSSAAITAMGLAEVNAVYGALGWTYAAVASFAVVYLGEHYVIDVLAGLAIAAAIHYFEQPLTPFVSRMARDLERISR